MNRLLLGTAAKTVSLLSSTKQPFLLIDDGPVADAFAERFPRAKIFDPTQHSFNPLKGVTPKLARDIATILYMADPGGENTLTVRRGRSALARLLTTTTRLDRITGDRKDPAESEALAMVDTALFTPLMRGVLCRPTNFSFKGCVIARIDRAELGDQDALTLALLLIGQFKGQVIVPDFGFYGRLLHMSLIRQNRLVAGVNFLSELEPKLRQAVLLIKDKIGKHTTYDDALELAHYAGLIPGVGNHTDFVQELTVPPAP